MITDKEWIAPIKPDKNYVFLLEHLEPAMSVEQLDRVIEKHNAGMHYNEIAEDERRNPAEIVIALIHQATSISRQNRSTIELTRPFMGGRK